MSGSEAVPTLIALLAVTLSLIALVRNRVSEEQRRKLEVTTLARNRVSEERRRRLEVTTLLQEYNSSIRAWGWQVIDKLTEAVSLCDLDPQKMKQGEFFEHRRQMLTDLSSLFDKGRLFFPNTDQDKVGLDKPSAFRGLRQQGLSLLNCAHELVKSLNYEEQEPNRPKRQKIVDVKREFTSEIQDALDIRKTADEIRRLAKEIPSANSVNRT